MYIFTKDPATGQKFRNSTSSGSFVMNDTLMQASGEKYLFSYIESFKTLRIYKIAIRYFPKPSVV